MVVPGWDERWGERRWRRRKSQSAVPRPTSADLKSKCESSAQVLLSPFSSHSLSLSVSGSWAFELKMKEGSYSLNLRRSVYYLPITKFYIYIYESSNSPTFSSLVQTQVFRK